MIALARHYRDGLGVARDQTVAKEWLRKCLISYEKKSGLHREAAALLKEMEADLL